MLHEKKCSIGYYNLFLSNKNFARWKCYQFYYFPLKKLIEYCIKIHKRLIFRRSNKTILFLLKKFHCSGRDQIKFLPSVSNGMKKVEQNLCFSIPVCELYILLSMETAAGRLYKNCIRKILLQHNNILTNCNDFYSGKIITSFLNWIRTLPLTKLQIVLNLSTFKWILWQKNPWHPFFSFIISICPLSPKSKRSLIFFPKVQEVHVNIVLCHPLRLRLMKYGCPTHKNVFRFMERTLNGQKVYHAPKVC